ncbi:hypothetical protein N7532_001546 [Penicillium argentinense]|uniref:F-box domain-containing protein n=1 Tax=Penicillium argentinense TaxID=1131581 RepID=A0A9W9G2P8_9EURO|nr:uncharacterized protein N7532_001546 [Penicillium argentinense]KAJ5111011.1 hypothetical protein N7532_001546 [Penicillium argentinense]
MTPFFGRVRAAVSRRGKRAYSFNLEPKESPWKRLPDNVFVALVAYCRVNDIAALALTCRLLHHRISMNEILIAQTYLGLRKQARLREDEDDADVSPGDELTFISELFPPPPPHYALSERHDDAEYSLAYISDLERCWTTCIQLSYHLADHAVRHHLETDAIARELWSWKKTEKEYVYSKAVEATQAKLLHPLAYAIFFLESSASDDSASNWSDQTTDLSVSIGHQQSILQRPPFNDTQILITVQHCMQLLCSTVRRLMHPDFPCSSSESWVSLLLLTSTLERIVQFFAAVAKDEAKQMNAKHPYSSPGSTWSHRKEFMWQMRDDLSHYLASSRPSTSGGAKAQPTLDDVWFGAAYRELVERSAIPHLAEEPVPVLHGLGISLRCKHCLGED